MKNETASARDLRSERSATTRAPSSPRGLHGIGAGLLLAGCVAACSGSSGSAFEPDGGNGSPGNHGTAGDGSVAGGGDGGAGSGDDGGGTKPADGGGQGSEAGSSSGGGVQGATNVQIIVEPNGNDDSELVAAIKAAKTSVHMTMYLFDDPNVITALVDQHSAGLDVKVVLNQVFPSGTTSQNPQSFSTLQSAGVGVVWANSTRFQYTHEKTVILDGTTAWIMTMNVDKSSAQDNREYLVIDDEPGHAAEADQIFAADYANQVIAATGNLVVAPQPPNNARSAIVAVVKSATKTLDIEAEEFSDFGTSGSGVVQAVAAAAQRGVKVRLVLAQGNATATQTEAITQVKAAGASVVLSGGSSGSGSSKNPYIHAKAMVADCAGTTCASGYIGSENFTGGSLGYNRELGLIISNGAELGKVESTIDADFKAGTAQ
jgi:cardiolipin synthase